MKQRTDLQKMQAVLQEQPYNRASKARLQAALGWEEAKFNRVLLKALEDGQSEIVVGKGGVVKYYGLEGAGLYHDVAESIRNHWAPKELKTKECKTHPVATRGLRGVGDWIHPDLVMSCRPAKSAPSWAPMDLHAFEIENRRGFGIRSVYQAHAQARGAHFAWVMTFADAADKKQEWMDRISWSAKEVGVGLVLFDSPSSSTSYRMVIKPKRLSPTKAEYDVFRLTVLGLAPNAVPGDS